MNPSTIYSKSGKGVQEASGKTSLLKRGDRAVLSAIDGRATLAEVAQKVGKSFDPAFLQLITQLDKDGFVREVTAAAASTGSRPVAPKPPAPKPAAPAAKTPPPAARSGGGGEDLDFTSIMPALKPGQSPASAQKAGDKAAEQRAKEQESALYKARQDAESRGQAERDRERIEMEARARTETEAKIRVETEKKVREEAAAKLKVEADARSKSARDAAVRMAAEAKAKAEADAKARIDAERLKVEAERLKADADRRAREEAERKAREDAERKAKEEAEKERKAREAEERKRKEEEEARKRKEEEARKRKEEEAARKRQEDEARRAREEADRATREQEEARRREEEDRRIREKEEQARVAERKGEEEEQARAAERKREEDERRRAEEERVRKSMEETKAWQPTLAASPPPAPAPAAKEGGPGSLDALMADLDSFSQREEQERSSQESAERKAREEKERRAKEESERRAKEAAELERREAEGRRRKAEGERREQEEAQRRAQDAERRAQEEAERRVREAEEQRRIAAEERNRKARESLTAKEARETLAANEARETLAAKGAQPRAVPAASDDIGVTDDDLHMDDVRQDEAVVAKESRKEQRERERETKKREREARERAQAATRTEPVKYSRPRRPVKWGKPLAMTLFLLLLVAVGALHVVPLPMSDYEAAASEALGRPVRIATGRLSLFTGVSLNLDGVTIGDSVKIAKVRAYPRFGSLIEENKAFRRMEIEGISIAQQALGETLFAKVQGKRFSVSRILVTKLNLAGPLPLPLLEADAVFGSDGALRVVTLRGPDDLSVKLTPADANVEFDGTASSFTLPFAPEVSLTSFAMKGIATRQGMNIAAWGGSILDGALSGTANVRWGRAWQVDGVVTVRGINAAVFAPALLSEGKAEGTGKFSMSGAEAAKLGSGARIDGSFTVNKGVLGSFDLSRALQTGGRQFAGRTQFAEMTGQGTYDRGAVALRNIIISAGALKAGASADIAQGGALNGRIVADVKTASQSLHQTLNLGGTMREPQVRN